MEKRIGNILIVIESKHNVALLNGIISDYAQIIIGRVGIPASSKNISLITLILEGTSDEINSLAGKLGKIEGIKVKSMLIKI